MSGPFGCVGEPLTSSPSARARAPAQPCTPGTGSSARAAEPTPPSRRAGMRAAVTSSRSPHRRLPHASAIGCTSRRRPLTTSASAWSSGRDPAPAARCLRAVSTSSTCTSSMSRARARRGCGSADHRVVGLVVLTYTDRASRPAEASSGAACSWPVCRRCTRSVGAAPYAIGSRSDRGTSPRRRSSPWGPP